MVLWSAVRPITTSDPGLQFIERGFVALQTGQLLWSASYIHFEWRKRGYSLPVNKFVDSWGNIICRVSYITPDTDVIFNPASGLPTPPADQATRIL